MKLLYEINQLSFLSFNRKENKMPLFNTINMLFISFMLLSFSAYSQSNDYVSEGNEFYENKKFEKAEESYNKALVKDKENLKGAFNLGDAFFRQDRFEEAEKQFQSIAKKTDDKEMKSDAYHNMGNSLLQQKKLEESIAAYKKSLINNPKNDASRYNLAYAQQMLKKQEEMDHDMDKDKKDDKDKEDEKDKKEDKDKKDEKKEENKDKDEKGDKDEKKEGEDKKEEDKKGDKEEDKKGEEGDDKKQQPKPNELSKEDAMRMLKAQQQQEEQTKDRLIRQQKKGKKVIIEKDW